MHHAFHIDSSTIDDWLSRSHAAATVIVDDQLRYPREAHNHPDGLRRPRDDGVVVAVRDEIGFM